MNENQRQVVNGLGCSMALAVVFGVGLIGQFIGRGMALGYVALLTGLWVFGILVLLATVQGVLDGGRDDKRRSKRSRRRGDDDDDDDEDDAPEPEPEPKSSVRMPSGWPPRHDS